MSVKTVFGLGKNLLSKILIFCFLFCGCPNGPNGPKNHPPEIEISVKEFTYGGKVEYRFLGIDEDKNIEYIKIKINGGNETDIYDNDFLRLVQIIKGENKVEATAYDNGGLTSDSVTYSFDSPSEEQARSFIENILASKRNTYNSLEKEVLVSIGQSGSFLVDYLVRKKDNTDAVINYVGHDDNLNKELSNKNTLDQFRIPNVWLARFPQDEIQSRLNEFINRGYKNE